MTKVVLNAGQKVALAAAIETREHLFITGGPGTGKSLVMERIIQRLRRKGKVVRVGAFTGLAALRLKGSTLSRLLGTGLAGRTSELRSLNLERAEENFDRVTDLVIDEISMVSGDFLDMMDQVLQAATGHEEPFGGIRMIFCGDFMQLPAVRHRSDPEFKWKWAFQHPLFSLAKVICLKESMRQADPADIQLLSEWRTGSISAAGAKTMESMVGRELVNPTELYPINKTVHMINAQRLAALSAMSREFITTYRPIKMKDMIKGKVPVGDRVVLKKGAPVIILANNPEHGYANGSQGIVVGMDYTGVRVLLTTGRTVTVDRKEWEIQDVKGNTIGVVQGLPIHLGWALTIHRAQGMTLDLVKTDVYNCFEPGQPYVGLTRTRSLQHVSITRVITKLLVDPDALAYTQRLEAQGHPYN